jgi:CxxC motif-containing protein
MEAEFKDPKKGDMKEIICIVCPNSCKLEVYKDETGEVQVEGYGCTRGLQYGKDEYTAPKRTIITTVRIENGELPVIPVRSKEGIPKRKMFEAMKVVNRALAKAPIKMGDVVIPNILGLGIDVVASRSMRKRKE